MTGTDGALQLPTPIAEADGVGWCRDLALTSANALGAAVSAGPAVSGRQERNASIQEALRCARWLAHW